MNIQIHSQIERGMILLTAIPAILSGACNAGLIAASTRPESPDAWEPESSSAFVGWFRAAGEQLFFADDSVRFLPGHHCQSPSRSGARRFSTAPLRQLESWRARLLVALTDDVITSRRRCWEFQFSP